jgi:uncharacterized protein YggE
MNDWPVVAVRGETVREVDPEIATFAVTASARDRDRQETLRRLAGRVDALRALLDGYAGAIESRETSGLYVHPETKRSGEKVTGYAGRVTTTVRVTDFAVLGELMLRLADQELTSVGGPWWELRPDSPVYREARRAAIDEAVARAREYAAALGARVTRLVELTDAGLGGGVTFVERGMVPRGYAGSVDGGAPQLDLEPQRQQVRASVEARFLISEPTVLADPQPAAD